MTDKIKFWTEGVEVQGADLNQLHNIAKLPILAGHIAVMPDVHFGMGATVGSVIPTRSAIIPAAVGAKSFIVTGKGNPESYCSCSHGAGRRMSRGAAKKAFTLDDLSAQTANVSCRKDAGVIDEIPGAYKDIDAVMAAQADLVQVEFQLKQILCVKG